VVCARACGHDLHAVSKTTFCNGRFRLAQVGSTQKFAIISSLAGVGPNSFWGEHENQEAAATQEAEEGVVGERSEERAGEVFVGTRRRRGSNQSIKLCRKAAASATLTEVTEL